MGPPAARAPGKSQRPALEVQGSVYREAREWRCRPGTWSDLTWPPGWETDAAMETARCSRDHRERKKECQQQDSSWPSRRQPPEAPPENTVLLRRMSGWGTVRVRVKKEEAVEYCIQDHIWGQHLLPKYTT